MTWVVLATLGIVAAVIAAGMIIDRRFGLLPRPGALRDAGKPGLKRPPHAPGEAPATALAAPPSTVRCRSCGRPAQPDEGSPDSRATLDERELVIRHYRCRRCGAITTIYCTS
jgi:ribosomal protein L37E